MAPEKSPAFQFYPADFLMDGKVQMMTLAERGAYITLLCLCWQERVLPAEPKGLARMLGVSLSAFTKLWPALERCFQQTADGWTHKRLEKERAKQAAFREHQRLAGRASAAHRTATEHQPRLNRKPTDVQPKGNSSISDLRSSSSVSDLPSPISDLQSSDSDQRTNGAANGAFDRFWARYPKKVGKDAALKVWNKRKPNIDVVLAALDAQDEWLSRDGGEYIPNPSTWLNQGRWQDEPPARKAGLSDTAKHNLLASDEAEQIILDHEAQRAHGHHR